MTTPITVIASSSPSLAFQQWVAQLPWWKRLAYRSKGAELALWGMIISGALLWQWLGVPWPLQRLALPVHIVVSIVGFVVLLVPFWMSHRQLLQRSKKPPLRITGRLLEIFFVVFLASGLWLTLVGNRGELVGRVAYWLHYLLSFPLMGVLLAHVWRYSVWREKKTRWLAILLVGIGALWAVTPAYAAQSSRSFLVDVSGETLYSANFDAGTVSRMARSGGQPLQEQRLGGELQRLALTDTGDLLAVTDTTGGRLLLLDASSLHVKKSLSLPGRPFAVVFDAHNHCFWVTLFEAHQLVAVTRQGKVLSRISTDETPRGLALLDDGRLLVTHAMIGKLSIYETRAQNLRDAGPALLRSLSLQETQNTDQFVSQGKPRLLDDIAVSPDGTEAWLPHVLWNFDHPFQFQSTIFPAVSVVSLTPGAEHEQVSQRKELFKQINLIEEGSRTRIISNPHDAEFTTDGKAVLVTLAGSEDLLVFDLSRRSAEPTIKKRSKRRQGKRDQGGEKATQIYRHTPGDNPRGLLILGGEALIQNAMSLDVSRFQREGEGPFAKWVLKDAQFARTSVHDDRAGDLRRGARLFYSANTDDFAATPMAGNFWMSCQSCHVDGFNFTNQYFFRDIPVDKHTEIRTGHRHLNNMIAGNFVGDYVRIIRDTQGGMGFDRRFSAVDTDPDKPSPDVMRMMAELHRFVRAPENLPAFPGWVRLTPEARVVHEKEWTNSVACKQCHSDIFDQWADSLHRLMGDSNPYYRVAEDIAADAEGEPFRAWCMSCHHPQGVLSGRTKTDGEFHMAEKNAASLFNARENATPDIDEGTGCLFCHRITRLEGMSKHGGGNASYSVNLDQREAYLFEEHSDPALRWLGDKQINAKPGMHAQSYSQPFYKDPQLCATCHNEVAPGTGALIVDTYGEWLESPFNAPNDPEQHRTCIDCHMHADMAKIGEPVPGIATDGGRLKNNVVTHHFTGANHHLVGQRSDTHERMSKQLLESAARLSVTRDEQGDLVVQVKNVGAGHAIPTGVADLREFWLEVRVNDTHGNNLLESGIVLPDGKVPEDARFFRKVFGDAEGKPVGLHFWRLTRLLEDTRIPPGGSRNERYALPKDVDGPLQVSVRLLFRIYPQAITDVVRQRFPSLPSPPVLELQHVITTLR